MGLNNLTAGTCTNPQRIRPPRLNLDEFTIATKLKPIALFGKYLSHGQSPIPHKAAVNNDLSCIGNFIWPRSSSQNMGVACALKDF